ncbi:MAG: hypothetical protein EBU90_02320 [Proteobacteria bacterium]|nr:hypothetical protein [Pseudomonadota bacterium]NBP13070.1 hypothetical protein [bacterium]
MSNLRPTYFSERVKVVPPISADILRYSFLNLQNAEPNLGVPAIPAPMAFDTYVLTTNAAGQRVFARTENWDSTYTTLHINSASWITVPQANALYFKASGGAMYGDLDLYGNLLIQGNFTVNGTFSALSASFLTTQQTSVSSLSVIAAGISPALYVATSFGAYDIAIFKDIDNNREVMRITDAAWPNGLGRVGINIYPNEEFTVLGDISASDNIYANKFVGDNSAFVTPDGSSALWNSVYNYTNTISSFLLTTVTSSAINVIVQTLSARSNIFTDGNIISGGRDIAQFLLLEPGLNVRALIEYLSSNNILLSSATFEAPVDFTKGIYVSGGASVVGGLTADFIYGQIQNIANFPVDSFTGTGSQQTFYLTQEISSGNDIMVYVSGIYQDKLTYSFTSGPGSSITFVEAPPAPDTVGDKNIEVVYVKANPLPIGIVSDNSITTQKLANYAVTIEKTRTGAFITSAGGTIYGNLSVVGTVSASNFVLVDGVLLNQAFDVGPGQTTFQLPSAVYSKDDLVVFVSGIYQRRDTYSLTTPKTLELSSPPPEGNKVVEVQYLRYFPYTLSVPAPNSVINSSIADNAISYRKLSGVMVRIEPQTYTGDGVTTQYNLVCAVATSHDLDVYFSGVYQNKDSYSIVPNNYTLTFVQAPPSAALIEINYRTVQFYSQFFTVPNLSITTPKIANLAVTSDKLDSNISIINDLAVGGSITAGRDITTGRNLNAVDIFATGNVTIYGNLTALGSTTVIDTFLTTTSALSVINAGSGPALVVRQQGAQPIAEFIDKESGTSLYVGDNIKVGIGTNNPVHELQVQGTLSAINIGAVQTVSATDIWTRNKIFSGGEDLADRLGDVPSVYAKFHGIQQARLLYTNTNPFSANWNLRDNQVANLYLSAGGNTLLSNPTNQIAGGTYILMVRTLSGNVQLFFDSLYRFPDGVTPTLTQGASAMDIFTFISDGRFMYGTSVQNYSWVP